jgi:RNA ligase
MSIFPTITNLEEFKANVGEIPGIEFITVPGGYTIASYYILDSKVFQNPYARECRGITFDRNGKLVSRPLHKFFNLGERESTLEKNVDWSTISSFMDKRDGSMISPVLFEDETIKFKTKRSFTSDPAVLVNDTFGPNTPQYNFSLHLCKLGYTPIFEITSPSNRIVVSYKETELVLLAVRHNETGKYATRQEIVDYAYDWNIPIVDVFSDVDIHKIKHDAATVSGIEGWVMQFNNGEMIKLKTAWYLSLHGSVTFTTEKNIAEMVIDETVDDFKSYCTSVGDLDLFDKVSAIETRVNKTLSEIIEEVNTTVATCGIETGQFKEFALTYNTHPLFWLLMMKFKGQEPAYAKYFLNNHLHEYSRECI